MNQDPFPVAIGDHVQLSKTLTETDVALFTAVSGDFDPIHVDEAHARTTPFGRRIAHGLLAMALLSGTASMMSAKARARGFTGTSVSLGYDRVRFVHPAFIGDTLTARYTIEALDAAKQRSLGRVTVENDAATLCVVGTHLMKWQRS
jgi:acyl dehydratase